VSNNRRMTDLDTSTMSLQTGEVMVNALLVPAFSCCGRSSPKHNRLWCQGVIASQHISHADDRCGSNRAYPVLLGAL
jgi:hypothetical protein